MCFNKNLYIYVTQIVTKGAQDEEWDVWINDILLKKLIIIIIIIKLRINN